MITLAGRSLVGRSPVCRVRLHDQRASTEHAAISWTGEHWEIHDLGSLNGTWVNDQRLRTGERVVIARGARLGFGAADGAWMFVDDGAVGPSARNELTGELVHASSGLLALPAREDPRATIYGQPDGRWYVEQQGDVRETADRERLALAGVTWTLFLPELLAPVAATRNASGGPLTLADIRLVFVPSLDEEHVDLWVHTDRGDELALPARSSHYTLLTLARLRLKDGEAAVAPDEQGWIHAGELADMLQYTAERLNVEIFRARTQLAKLGVTDSMQLIERRVSSRQLRLGVARLTVRRA